MTSCATLGANPDTCIGLKTSPVTLPSSYPQSCKQYQPDADSANAGNMTQNILSKLSGAKYNCDLSSFNASVAGKVSAPLDLGSASFAAQVGTLNKSGCQVVAALVGNYLNSVYQARCVIENDASKSTTQVLFNQNMSETAIGRGSSITSNCPSGGTWSQNLTNTVTSLTSISSASQDSINAIVQAGLNNTVSQLGQIKDGFQGTGSGAQSVTTIQNTIKQQIQDSSVKNAITAAVTNFKYDQAGIFTALQGGTISNVPCNYSQNAMIDLQIAGIISNAYTSQITESVASFLKSSASQKTGYVDPGAPNVVGALFASNWGIIVGAIALLIIGVVVIKALKTKGVQDALSKGIGQAGGGLGGARGLSRL